MKSEPRTVLVSKDNVHSAIETFLRALKEVKDNERVTEVFALEPAYLIKISQEVEQPVDHTAH